MTTERLYRKADRADDIADLDLTDADPKELAKVLYESWLSSTAELRYSTLDDYNSNLKSVYDKIGKEIYHEAARIVRPFAGKFSGTISTAELSARRFKEENYALGYFLSALLDETGAERLLITDPPREIYELALHRSDKIVDIAANCRVNTLHSNVRTITINHGEIFIDRQKYGFQICYGKEPWSILGFEERKVCVMAVPVRGTYSPDTLYQRDFEKDAELSGFVGQMETASNGGDIPLIRKLARKIDGHVRKNYPRGKRGEWKNRKR